MQEQPSIAFLGAGNMARAMIAGLCKADYSPERITAVNRTASKNQALQHEFGIHANTNLIQSAQLADVIVLGVKPQMMSDLMQQLQGIDWQNKLVISMAAGITCDRLDAMAQRSLNLVRVMPNTPALLGQGMTGIYARPHINDSERQWVSQLMQAIGKICWVDDEKQMNSVIAAAGSAPAYFFFFMQAMQEEAIRQGFSPETARELIQQSALGAAQMVVANPELDLAMLRAQVTSKGGTTEQAILTFEQMQLTSTVAKAMQAAIQRAEEMETLF